LSTEMLKNQHQREKNIMKLEWDDLFQAMSKQPKKWHETTQEMYDEMLGAVPPQAWYKGMFLVGEANYHNAQGEAVYSCFIQYRGCFRAMNMTQAQFTFRKKRAQRAIELLKGR